MRMANIIALTCRSLTLVMRWSATPLTYRAPGFCSDSASRRCSSDHRKVEWSRVEPKIPVRIRSSRAAVVMKPRRAADPRGAA
jgi:hypothetical protein